MTDEMFYDYMDENYNQCGCSADFFGRAWAITHNLYVADMENGKYMILETDLYSGEAEEDNILLVGNSQECISWLVDNRY